MPSVGLCESGEDLCDVPFPRFSEIPCSASPRRLASKRGLRQVSTQCIAARQQEGEGITPIPRKKKRLRQDIMKSTYVPHQNSGANTKTPPAIRTSVWARQGVQGRSSLRKAAILNSISTKKRDKLLATAEIEEGLFGEAQNRLEACRPLSVSFSNAAQEFRQKALDACVPLEYAIFDYEDNFMDDHDLSDDEDSESAASIYDDFHVLQFKDDDIEVYNEDYSFDSFDTGMYLGEDYEEKPVNLILRNGMNDEVSVSPVLADVGVNSNSHWRHGARRSFRRCRI